MEMYRFRFARVFVPLPSTDLRFDAVIPLACGVLLTFSYISAIFSCSSKLPYSCRESASSYSRKVTVRPIRNVFWELHQLVRGEFGDEPHTRNYASIILHVAHQQCRFCSISR